MSDSFEVGQVVYVISRKESRVYPVLVVEETVRKTLEGRITTYMVRLPDKKGTVVPLDGIADRGFSRAEELREYLVTSATKSINTMVDEAVRIGRSLAPAGDEPAQDREPDAGEEGTIMVDMPDGTRARLKTPNLPVQT